MRDSLKRQSYKPQACRNTLMQLEACSLPLLPGKQKKPLARQPQAASYKPQACRNTLLQLEACPLPLLPGKQKSRLHDSLKQQVTSRKLAAIPSCSLKLAPAAAVR
nr:hypothetical protein [Pseudomonas sp. BIGb0427]